MKKSLHKKKYEKSDDRNNADQQKKVIDDEVPCNTSKDSLPDVTIEDSAPSKDTSYRDSAKHSASFSDIHSAGEQNKTTKKEGSKKFLAHKKKVDDVLQGETARDIEPAEEYENSELEETAEKTKPSDGTVLAENTIQEESADDIQDVAEDSEKSDEIEDGNFVETPQEQTQQVQEESMVAILNAIEELQTCFNEKIAQDEQKNKMFDNMHEELVKYQNGLIDKITDELVLDIIQLIDKLIRDLHYYKGIEPNEENYNKLLERFSEIVEDMQEILYRQEVEPYFVEGKDIDVRRQNIIQSVETSDQTLNNKVAARVALGYKKNGRIIRPEKIKIYKYNLNASGKGE